MFPTKHCLPFAAPYVDSCREYRHVNNGLFPFSLPTLVWLLVGYFFFVGYQSAAAEAPPIDPAILREVETRLKKSQEPVELEFQKVATIAKQEKPIAAMAFSSDASRIATCTIRGVCRVWELSTGKELCQWEEELPMKRNFSLAMFPNGKQVVVGGAFPDVYVFDAETGKTILSYSVPETGSRRVDVSSDSKWVSAIGNDNLVYRWPSGGGTDLNMTVFLPEETGTVFAVASDGLLAVSALKDKMIARESFFPEASVDHKSLDVNVPFNIRSMAASKHLVAALSLRGKVRVFNRRDFPRKLYKTGSGMFHERSGRLLVPDEVVFSPEEDYLTVAIPSGKVEVHDILYSARWSFWQLPVKRCLKVRIAPDARTIGFAERDGTISCWRLPSMPVDTRSGFHRLLVEYIRAKKFEHLDALGKLLENDSEAFSWYNFTTKYCAMMLTMETQPILGPLQDFDEFYQEWLKARPGSPLAAMRVAFRHMKVASAARGSGFAHTVSEEGWKVFHAEMEKARELMQPLVDSGDCPPHAFSMLFEVAKSQGWEREKVDAYVDKLMKQAPWYFPAHMLVAVKRLPRWGGENGDSAKYACFVADGIGGDAGDIVYARIGQHLSRYSKPGVFFETEKYDYDRIVSGFNAILQQRPDDPYTLHALFRIAYYKQDRPAARKYLAHIRKLHISSLHSIMPGRQYSDAIVWTNNRKKKK